VVVEYDFQGRAAVLELHDGWDEDHVGQLLDAATRAIERDRTTLVFDLANLADLDSAVLRFLADVQTVADRSGWTILLVLPAPSSVPEPLARSCATFGSLATALLAISRGTERACAETKSGPKIASEQGRRHVTAPR
jgi:anti-anti-sigma regulatory factor